MKRIDRMKVARHLAECGFDPMRRVKTNIVLKPTEKELEAARNAI